MGILPSHLGPIFADFPGFVDSNIRSEGISLRNGRFSDKEMRFSDPWVVWSLLGAAGEKKRENQMYLQDLIRFTSTYFFCTAPNSTISENSKFVNFFGVCMYLCVCVCVFVCDVARPGS